MHSWLTVSQCQYVKLFVKSSSEYTGRNLKKPQIKGTVRFTGSIIWVYKLHLLIGANGVYAYMELIKVSTHDACYLNEVKHCGISECLLLGDKGYISKKWQLDLFTSAGIELHTPKRANQKNYKPWPGIYKYTRRRIEVYFSQLCDQMMVKRNYAKTFNGLKTRIIAKVTSVTILQYINSLNGKPINHIKHALAA